MSSGPANFLKKVDRFLWGLIALALLPVILLFITVERVGECITDIGHAASAVLIALCNGILKEDE